MELAPARVVINKRNLALVKEKGLDKSDQKGNL